MDQSDTRSADSAVSVAPLSPDRPLHRLTGFGIFLFLALTIYAPALTGAYIWDDLEFVLSNRDLSDTAGLARIWMPGASTEYYPVIFSSFWVERRLWGLDPLGYHVVNVIFHAANAFLVWIILHRLRSKYAFFGALLFAIHPVHVESVAWIIERKNVLSGFFALLSMYEFLGLSEGESRFRYYRSLLWFLLALLGKTVVAPLPMVLLVLHGYLGGRFDGRFLARWIPFLCLSLLLSAVRISLEFVVTPPYGASYDWSWSERLILSSRALWFYPGKFIWPFQISPVYFRWQIDETAWTHWIGACAAAAILVSAWALRSQIGSGVITALAAYVLMISPAIGWVSHDAMRFTYTANRYAYLASIPLLALLAAGIDRVGVLMKVTPDRRRVLWGVLALALSILSLWESRAFQGEPQFWETAIEKNPKSAIAHNNYGVILIHRDKLALARQSFETAISLDPRYASPRFNLARLLRVVRQIRPSIRYYRDGLRLDPANAAAHHALGILYAESGEDERALRHFQMLVDNGQATAEIHFHLGFLFAGRNQTDTAIRHYEAAIRMDATNADVRNELGTILFRLRRDTEARMNYENAIWLDPNNPHYHNNLGVLLVQTGRLGEAAEEFRKALALDTAFMAARENLAKIKKGN